jgi:hypothetical protein
MSNSQANKEPQLPSPDGLSSNETNQQSHFVHARKIIESWPEWKRNIRCTPISLNCNRSSKTPDNA